MRLGTVTAREMADIDAALIGPGWFEPSVLIEQAGFAVALAARQRVADVRRVRIVVLVGSGANGIDGIAAARRLASWGATVTILLAEPRTDLLPTALAQLELAEAYTVRVFDPGALMPEADLILDAVIGYRLRGSLEAAAANLVRTTERLKVPIIAIDVPSCLDATTGKAGLPAIRAEQTITLGYPKIGLTKPYARPLVGELLVADVLIPPSVWQRRSLTAPDFSQGPLVPVDR